MGIKHFNIEYERDVFYPGQMVSGSVCLSIDKPEELKGKIFCRQIQVIKLYTRKL